LKHNHLNHFKIFPGTRDILLQSLGVFAAFAVKFTLFSKHYTYKSIIMQNLKSTESPIKSTENILSVDLKSTAKLPKTSKTRCQLTSLSKKTKKINLDQQ